MERKGIPQLEAIGLEIKGIDDESNKLRAKREKLCQQGIALMKEHTLLTYKVEGIVLELKPGVDKLSVKTDKTSGSEQKTDAA